jgi:hypothetical protein
MFETQKTGWIPEMCGGSKAEFCRAGEPFSASGPGGRLESSSPV